MGFDLLIVCVDYTEPAVWIALAVGSPLCILVGHRIGRLVRRFSNWGSRAVVAVTCGAVVLVAAVPLEIVLVQFLFSRLHDEPGRVIQACTHFVTGLLLVPPVLAWCTAAMASRRPSPEEASA